MNEVRKEHAKRRVSFGLKHRRGPIRKEHSNELSKLPARSPLYMFRQKSNKWEGPFSFIQLEGETDVVQMPAGRKIFRSHVVKAKVPSDLERKPFEGLAIEGDETLEVNTRDNENSHDICAITSMKPDDKHTFVDSMRADLEGLRDRDTF